MSRAVLTLPRQRQLAQEWITKAPDGTRLEFKGPKRTIEQNEAMWAALTDVASQLEWHGAKLSISDWKIMFLDALDRDRRTAVALDGKGFVQLGRSSSNLSKEEFSDLLDLIYAFGAKHGVQFNDPNTIQQRDATRS